MGNFILSEFVEPDLAIIWDYIANDNIDAADRLLTAAYETFALLAGMPGMGHPRHFSAPRIQNMRSFPVKGFVDYLIFYNPLPDGIEVFHVYHGARNIEALFANG